MEPPSEAGRNMAGDRYCLLPASNAPFYSEWQVLAFLVSPLLRSDATVLRVGWQGMEQSSPCLSSASREVSFDQWLF